jgi:hypothetical protein
MKPWLHPRVSAGEWVLLTYRLPRVPSTPRISVWRKLKRLGVAQLADGLVALPADARTREQLEWVADEIREAAGTAGVWLARPASEGQERELARSMAAARAIEYAAVLDQVTAAAELSGPDGARAIKVLREELRRIRRRDFFPTGDRDAAVDAVGALARQATEMIGSGPVSVVRHPARGEGRDA